tara:strand:+ start:203 stop:415 length:213 start_codon:yes stop_codon:yes gene_type:complete
VANAKAGMTVLLMRGYPAHSIFMIENTPKSLTAVTAVYANPSPSGAMTYLFGMVFAVAKNIGRVIDQLFI